ncbi:membrane protease subunit HflC [Arboricoccus pini]|uniref:Protein HflC n=1 Tax=Arboricoccus pini TaxID=1963835 RepID=A0A212QYR9_9PROT|nr:protease modulator HflC [Arboricoccus pini]SNB64894.1 membrane protease subunit HflC [Arboricoccus pini]
MNRALVIVVSLVIILVLLAWGALYTVDERRQALVLQFGEPIENGVVRQAGLHVKLPFIQQVTYYDKRVLDFDAPQIELVLGDQKRIVVSAFARYRIVNPLLFRQASGDEVDFRTRLEPITFSTLRSVLGETSLTQLLSNDRTAIMNRIKSEANRALERFGVEVVDVRIKRADLPEENSEAVFSRMQTEREREARELRAQGAELGQRIKSRADRERRVIIAEAEKTAAITRGEGDAEAVRIFADAYAKDSGFFEFYRSMQAYRAALSDGSTNIILTPDNQFFRYFDDPTALPSGKGAAGANAQAGVPARQP